MKFYGIIFLICGIIFIGCGEEDDEVPSSEVYPCECKFNSMVEENGILFRYENHSVRKPANVSVLFKVMTKDGGLPNLTADNFKLFENNRFISAYESQQAILPKPGSFQSHILLLLDLSGSILNSNSLPSLKEAAKSFVLTIMPPPTSPNFGEVDMSIMWFDGSPELHNLISFTKDVDLLISSIDTVTENISNDSSTNLYGAIINGVEIAKSMVGFVQNTVSVSSVVLFTDGTDQASRRSREDAAKSIEKLGNDISIYTIGLGGEIFESELAFFGRNGFVFASKIDELVPKFNEIASRIKDDLNSHYLLEYCSPKRDGSHILTISLQYKELSGLLSVCFCAKGFEGGCTVK